MRYRLIATDLDETLLDGNSAISARSKDAIQGAVKKGVKFVIATGRMFKTSLPYLLDLELTDRDWPLINYHGAMIKTALSKKVILERPLDNKLAIAIAEAAVLKECYVSIFIDDRLYIGEENEYSRYYQSLARIDLEPVGDLVNFLKQCQADPSKLSIICWDGRLNEIETYLKSHFNGEISVLQSRPYFLEITDRHATKGQALHWLAEREGIKPEEIIAFGDGHNDIDMLRYAGLGVAVANAHSEVLEAADFVTLSNMEDGVAEVIEKYVLGQ